MWEQANWFLSYMTNWVKWLVSIRYGYFLEGISKLNKDSCWLFFVLFWLTPSLIISRAITPLFLSVCNYFCFVISLASLFVDNAWDMLLMIAAWIQHEHYKKQVFIFCFLQFNCFTVILIIVLQQFFTLFIIICKLLYLLQSN